MIARVLLSKFQWFRSTEIYWFVSLFVHTQCKLINMKMALVRISVSLGNSES